MNTKKGFTIIELVVVIAIIAILAAIVLISVSGYIQKSQDSAIKSTMHTLLTDAVASGPGVNAVYTGCGSTPMSNDWTAITKLQTDATKVYCAALSSGADFIACAQLLAVPGDYWCVDSTGKSEQKTGTCSSSLNTCP